MEKAQYCRNLIEEYQGRSAKGPAQFLFFHQPGNLSQADTERCLSFVPDGESLSRSLIHSFRSDESDRAFSPVFGELAELISSPDDFKVCFHPLQELLKKAIMEGRPQREHPLPLAQGELEFGAARLKESLFRLMEEASGGKPLLLVWSNLHEAPPSTLDLILWGMNQRPETRVLFLLIGDRNAHFLNPERDTRWQEFSETVEHLAFWAESPLDASSGETARPEVSPNPLQVWLDDGAVALGFYAWEEARANFNRAVEWVDSHTDAPLLKEKTEAYLGLGDACLYMKDPDSAMYYFNNIASVFREQNNRQALAEVWARQALVNIWSENPEKAFPLLRQAFRYWEEAGDTLSIDWNSPLALRFCGKEWDFFPLPEYNHIAARLYERKWINLLATFFTDSAYILEKSHTDGFIEALRACRKGIRIALTTKNTYRVSVGYHTLGILYQTWNDQRRAYQYYKKCETIRRGLGNELELIKISNGLGYFCLSRERLARALGFFYQSLELLEGSNNIPEIALTAYNIGMTYLTAGETAHAAHYLEGLLTLLYHFRLDQIPYHSRSEIYPMLGILYAAKGMKDKAQGCLEKSENAADQNPNRLFYQRVLREVLSQGIAAVRTGVKSGRMDFQPTDTAQILLLRHFLSGERRKHQLPFRRFRVEQIRKGARQEETLSRLNARMQELHFLNQLQTILGRSQDTSMLLAECAHLMSTHFQADRTWAFSRKDHNLRLVTSIPMTETFDPSLGEKILFNSDVLTPGIWDVSQDYSEKGGPGPGKVLRLPVLTPRGLAAIFCLYRANDDVPWSSDETSSLILSARQISMAFERVELTQDRERIFRELEIKNRQFERELEMSRRVQESVLSLSAQLDCIPGVSVGFRRQFMESVGGDLVDIHPMGEGKTGFLIADVSGHGVPAAFISTMAKVSFGHHARPGLSAGMVLERVNADIQRMIGDLDHFVAAYYGVLDTSAGVFEYANAGHHSAILFRRKTGNVEKLDASGPVMGFLELARYETGKTDLEPGDRLLFVTDGILEARGPDGEFFEFERISDFFVRHADLEPQGFVDALFGEIDRYSGTSPQMDDRAALCVEWKSEHVCR